MEKSAGPDTTRLLFDLQRMGRKMDTYVTRLTEITWAELSLKLLHMCEKAKKSKEERGYESLPICHRGPENGIQEADGESGIPSFREMNGSGNSNVYQ